MGEAVEYVQIGMPEHQIGTISSVDGSFEITVPPDTLGFFHVSYQTASYPVTGAVDDLVIVLHDQELPPAVREAALGEMKPIPVNIGIAVKGLEYQQ